MILKICLKNLSKLFTHMLLKNTCVYVCMGTSIKLQSESIKAGRRYDRWLKKLKAVIK